MCFRLVIILDDMNDGMNDKKTNRQPRYRRKSVFAGRTQGAHAQTKEAASGVRAQAGLTEEHRAEGRTSRNGAPRRQRRNFIAELANHWFDRVMGGVRSGELSGQEQYSSHRTSRDFIWNTIGIGCWGMVFPILTIVATQLAGVEQAGMLSMAFVTGTLLMILANFGVRTYQVSDIEEKHSFSDYQINRWITCVLMVLVGVVYCNIRGYDSTMFYISIGIYLYRMVDGLADVYEGRLQQADKLYLAGISQAIRSVAVLVIFSVLLFITRNMVVASFGMAIVAFATFVVITLPLALMETPKSRKASVASIAQLFKECAPLFIALFLYSLIDNMPKFVMEGTLSYDNQLYFNALYFPAQGILLTVQLVYKPLLVRMANVYNDPRSRRKFTVIVVGIFLLIVAVTVVNVFIMGWIGLPIMSFLYGIDFEQFRGLCFIMLAAGGVTAAIDFLYQVITVMRRQKSVMKLYIITFGFALFVPTLLIMFTGLPGAAIAYLIVMTILFVLLVWEYFRILASMAKQPPAAPDQPKQAAEPGVSEQRMSEQASTQRSPEAAVPQDSQGSPSTEQGMAPSSGSREIVRRAVYEEPKRRRS